MSEIEPTYQHPNRHPHLRQAVHFLTAQILTEPHPSGSDHYHPVVLDPILDVQANGEYLDIALRAPHQAWDTNKYYEKEESMELPGSSLPDFCESHGFPACSDCSTL